MPGLLPCRGKGPIWAMFDRYFSSLDLAKRLRHKLEVLEALHANPRFTDFDRGPGGSGLDIPDLKRHIRRDWFGLSDDGSTSISEESGCTGAWQGWRGDAEGIVREALIRGIEVSLGLEHVPWTGDRSDPLRECYQIGPYGTPRNWPMEFWCSGPVPFLQASLHWHSYGEEHGRVEITWLLPAVADQPFAAGLREGTGGFQLDPPNPMGDARRTGSWIVSQEYAQEDGGIHVSSGEVVVAEPTLAAGGVDCDSDPAS